MSVVNRERYLCSRNCYPISVRSLRRQSRATEYVITRYRDRNCNLRTQLERIIKRAGLTPWPKLFQNLRSTRETELAETWPVHVVCSWIGNSQAVAQKHYLQITNDHFAIAATEPPKTEAAHNAAQLDTTEACNPSHVIEEPSICEQKQGLATQCEGGNGR